LHTKTKPDLNSDKREAVRRRLVWFLLLRLCVATLFLGGTILYQLRIDPVDSPELPYLFGMVAATYLQSGVVAFFLQKTGRLNLLAQTVVSYDLLLATFLIYVTGGFVSHFSFLYLLIIFSASLFVRRRDLLLVASAAAILYGSLLDLQYYQKLPLFSGLSYAEVSNGSAVLYAVFLHVCAFFLSAILCSVLVESRSKSELALEKKEIDLDELESLNRSILANINSGLMLVSETGNIRSFNKSAEEITGCSFYDVYDRDVRKIFPCFDLFDTTGFNHIIRGETDFQSKSGQILTLGYSTTEVRDVEQKNLGLLVVFQDLTELIEMDLRLRRADQQAAVGRLASGMAHEIRNPLAAISGSVQLLLEGGDVDIEDRRLMEIVVSEADRLSLLLTDFLSFAKPQKTELEKFDFSELCDQVIDILQSDPRFLSVTIIREYPPDCTLFGDRKQLQQVLIDLAINGAEAMNGAGMLFIGFNSETTTLYVEDTGNGVPPDIVSKIFEPFFTTKQAGTGLGLATVQAIIAAHAGDIDLLPGRQGGAKFVITLPQQRQKTVALFNRDEIMPECGKNES
jgi:two-component system sensor histidine kinase PilS (NtrC family)